MKISSPEEKKRKAELTAVGERLCATAEQLETLHAGTDIPAFVQTSLIDRAEGLRTDGNWLKE